MPRLITDKKRPNRASLVYSAPSSPFQLAIDAAMKAKNLTFQDMGEELGINKGTFWSWIHTTNGYPSPRSCRPAHLEAMARVLDIPVPRLKELLDESRRLYTKTGLSSPESPGSRDVLAEVIAVFENDKRKQVTKAYVLNILRRFHASIIANNARTRTS